MRARFAAILGGGLLATVHVACYDKPDAPHVGQGTDGGGGEGSAMIDAPAVVDAPASCTAAHDDFETSPINPCGAWGMQLGTTGTTRMNGKLYVAPLQPSDIGGCKTNSAFILPAVGTSIQIPQPATDNSGMQYTTYFQLTQAATTNIAVLNLIDDSGQVSFSLVCMGSMGNMTTNGAIDPTTTPWIRMRPLSGILAVEAGSDGTAAAYGQIATCPFDWLGVSVNAEFGVKAVPAMPGTAAQFDNFNVRPCPTP